ncbi:isochorismate synthase of siderophore biosynthesis [Vibrio metschnikovii]|uniref:isochorismate synthase n=2 Tax=Bacteria TaxID=2 RepID=UPI0001B94B1E|nr:isochorismate synthase [Vibrio metschnikovii]EEX36338.1 isochorismate synthase of siderophore biosynthesis [Vibrio metschnikovii CIP 69.14]MBC5830598.1 isochorismate synthase [Vibrio metschnikovii]SUP79683.1 isochorismate synthase of siderophore biosynthesis [Vibrio metschnikovii]SUQ10420.1 isochorismate synthase of siderophore biosynthesis [Vibrio metschnikovii]
MKREVVGFSRMAEELLSQELETAPFFFASPHNSMLGVGIEQQLDQAIPFSELALRANQMLEQVKKSENDNPVLFAIVPFDEKTPTKFFIPEKLYISSSARERKNNKVGANKATVISPPTGNDYKQGVATLLNLFNTTDLSKVVLSRSVRIATDQIIDQNALLRNLLAINSLGYTFAVDIGKETKLMGASPELLLAKKGGHVVSNPLAGSRPKSINESDNQISHTSLLDTQKDLNEHSFVVEEVEKVLSGYCRNLFTPMVPSVIETETMLHLSTRLEGQAIDPDINSLQIAAELHPTPAVCGFPRHSAYQAIKQIEKFERGYFCGMIGWCDARGNGEWVVTIRCAEVSQREMCIFAGAGIVHESSPQSELEETGAKMSTILKAAGIKIDELLTA